MATDLLVGERLRGRRRSLWGRMGRVDR